METFLPTIWEQDLLENFRGKTLAELVTFPAQVKGEKVVFNRLIEVTTSSYTKGATIAYGEAGMTSVNIPFNKTSYFALQVEDIVEVQQVASVRGQLMQSGAYKMRKDVDADLIAKINASDATKTTATKIGYDELVDGVNRLMCKDVPTGAGQAVIIAHPSILAELSKDERFTRHYQVLENGVVDGASVNGVQLIVSSHVPVDEAHVIYKGAIGFGMQLQTIESGRMQDHFADYIRGLIQWGLEVVIPEGIETIKKGK